eukprot:4235831-Amphidinium_carterae.1
MVVRSCPAGKCYHFFDLLVSPISRVRLSAPRTYVHSFFSPRCEVLPRPVFVLRVTQKVAYQAFCGEDVTDVT